MFAVAAVTVSFSVASAAPAPTGASTKGAVIALKDTPHLWFADEQGVLHWGGDTRALAGHDINWNSRVELSLDQLKALPIGDPWLSAGLLKDGDPIYLVKWETNQSVPTLLHIQSIADVELFGTNSSNYGAMVLDQTTWDARFGMSASGLQRSDLAAAVATPTAVPTAAAKPTATPAPTSTPRLEPTAIPRSVAPTSGTSGGTCPPFSQELLAAYRAAGYVPTCWVSAGLTTDAGFVRIP